MQFWHWEFRPRRVAIVAGCIGIALLLFAYAIRPVGVIHGPAMLFYKYPLLWKLPLLTWLGIFTVTGLAPRLLLHKTIRATVARLEEDRRRCKSRYDRSPGWQPRFKFEHDGTLNLLKHWYKWPATLASFVAVVALVFAICTAGMFTGQAIYKHYRFTDIGRLPANGKVRILPKQVAEQLATSGYNSSTSRLAQAHIVVDADGHIAWTFGEVPNGTLRKYTAKTEGVATLDAESTSRNMALTKRDFDISTNVRWTDDLKWQAYKRHFFTDVAETVYVVTASGEPVIIAPYLKYVGFWVKVPELAGVYVVHPDGRMEDLSPDEAEERPFIVQSGRMFPEELARRIQDSYQYKDGIANRLFTHKDQTQIADTESNSQPYLMDFGDRGTKWVSTAQPYGKAQATNAIFLTDTITGRTEIWHVPEGEAYTGNSKALDIVRALSIPGITFAARNAVDSAGKFEAVEPRPVIVNGRLQFMISVIPNSDTTVTKTIVVDAKTNKAVAVFNHDTDPNADRKLRHYLHSGTLPPDAGSHGAVARSQSVSAGDHRRAAPDASGAIPGSDGSVSDAELQALVNKLLQSNRAQQEAIVALRYRLESTR